EPGQAVTKHGVHIVGYVDLPSRMAPTASQLYGMNLVHFLSDLGGAEKWNVNLEDEVLRGSLVTHEGSLMWPPPPIEHPKEVVKSDAETPIKVGPTPEQIKAKKARASAL